ncbi:MAG TPA: hypothetical protein VF331_23900 [Polyangiales bacterium]
MTVTGVVKELKPGIERQKYPTLQDVEVCVYEHPQTPCVKTSSAGTYSMCGVPANSELLLSFKKDGYAQALRMLSTRQEDYAILAETVLGSIDYGVSQLKHFDYTAADVSGGAIQFFAANPANGVLQVATLEGYTAKLENVDGTQAICAIKGGTSACRPVYLDDTGTADPTLTKSSHWGVGAFGNVPAGKYVLRITHPTLVCNQHLPESGWKAKDADSVLVESVTDWITAQTGVFCQEPDNGSDAGSAAGADAGAN